MRLCRSTNVVDPCAMASRHPQCKVWNFLGQFYSTTCNVYRKLSTIAGLQPISFLPRAVCEVWTLETHFADIDAREPTRCANLNTKIKLKCPGHFIHSPFANAWWRVLGPMCQTACLISSREQFQKSTTTLFETVCTLEITSQFTQRRVDRWWSSKINLVPRFQAILQKESFYWVNSHFQ